MSDWNEEYKEKVRAFIAQHGAKVEFEDRRWGQEVSIYGWHDYEAYEHIKGSSFRLGKQPGKQPETCSWIVPEGAELSEESYSMFQDTFSGNQDEVGVNVSGCRCACGKYTDVTLRWVGTVTDMLHSILQLPDARLSITL